ncbi:hypothetical protein C5Y97_01635 [Blastopirellula marina]|uniref:Uncharacterized protein n=2 Tax=Blastopirellula marina TaxID=124 RepID=A0A2S8GDN7_9BACT|nr:hypothetical protein C5Y98_01635 [Blastopirellula marina]PTL46332.1 hypothetical protein C5Y97_01635 [Blastopirellula marina]
MTITLNLPTNLTAQQWSEVDQVFRSMDGWIGYCEADQTPQWFGDESAQRFVWASVELSVTPRERGNES